MKRVLLCLPLMTLVLLTGCVSIETKPVSEQILGAWSTTIGGYPVNVTYTAKTVEVKGADPVAYQLAGDRLQFPDGGSQVRVVSFPSPDEMVQTDPMTGTRQHYERIAPQATN